MVQSDPVAVFYQPPPEAVSATDASNENPKEISQKSLSALSDSAMLSSITKGRTAFPDPHASGRSNLLVTYLTIAQVASKMRTLLGLSGGAKRQRSA